MYSPDRVQLLVVDDDDEFRGTVLRRFARRGFRVEEAPSGAEALDLSARKSFDVAIVDLMMPGMSGLELLARLKELHPDCQIVMLTGQGTIETAVEAMKQGAYDFLTKPFPLGELEVVIQKAYERHRLQKENKQLAAALERSAPKSEIVGKSAAMREVFRLIERTARRIRPS